jgi:hypothetical protein
MLVPFVTPGDLVQDFVRKYNETAEALRSTPFHVLVKDLDLTANNNYTIVPPSDYTKLFFLAHPLIILNDAEAPYTAENAPIISLGVGQEANSLCPSLTLTQNFEQSKMIPLTGITGLIHAPEGIYLQVQRKAQSTTAFAHLTLSYLIIE